MNPHTQHPLNYQRLYVPRPGAVPGKIVFWILISFILPPRILVIGGFLVASLTR